MENKSPLGVSSPKLSSSKAKCSLLVFCKQLLLVPSWALIFCENSKSLLLQKPARSCLHVQQRPRPETFLPTFAQFPAAPPAPPGPQDTSPSPALPVQVSQVNMSNSSRQGHQSMLDPPLFVFSVAEPTPTQPIPDSVPEDVKGFLENSPPFCTRVV